MSALLNHISQYTFMDGRTFHIGGRIRIWTKYGTECNATVIGFGRSQGAVTVKAEPDAGTDYGGFDRWPLKRGGEYNRIRDVGVFGGEIRGGVK